MQDVELPAQLGAEIQHRKFIPFLALHEFETWVFFTPEIVAGYFDRANLSAKVQQVIDHAGEPKFINHGETTHPKARLPTQFWGR